MVIPNIPSTNNHNAKLSTCRGGGGGGGGWRRTLEARSQVPENEGKIVEIGDRVRIQR